MQSTNYAQMCRTIELVDAVGVDLVERVCKAVLEGRRKYPEFASCWTEGMHAVSSEFYEFLSQAIAAQRPDGTLRPERVEKAEGELLDLITVCMRMLAGEYPRIEGSPEKRDFPLNGLGHLYKPDMFVTSSDPELARIHANRSPLYAFDPLKKKTDGGES